MLVHYQNSKIYQLGEKDLMVMFGTILMYKSRWANAITIRYHAGDNVKCKGTMDGAGLKK